jgi:hypothetical protein
MNRAAGYFEEAGDSIKAAECKAYVLRFEKMYLQAGNKFAELGMSDMATQSFWEGCCWEELIKFGNRAIYKLAAKFMIGEMSFVDFLKNEELIDKISNIDETWMRIVLNINTKSKEVEPNMFSIVCGLLEKLVYRGFTLLNPTIADLYFKNKQYIKAIEKWDDLAKVNHDRRYSESKLYYTAKKETCVSLSDKIFWMNKLQEYDAICERYSDSFTAESLTEDAVAIVFTCLLSRNYEKAVSYPYPKDEETKWNRLYAQNRVRFLTDVVLDDFTLDKFYFLSDKIQLEERGLFDEILPVSVFELIFSLKEVDENGRPYWTYFTSMRKNNGVRVFKESLNRERILEALSKDILSGAEYDKSIASCFLDFLFDDEFNVKRADKFNRTLITIFSHGAFYKADFRKSMKRNKYFTAYSELDNNEHETIKNNVRSYVDYYFSSLKKLNSKAVDDAKNLLRAYEVCVPYQGINPDYFNICNMYKKYMKEKKFAEIKDWMEQRVIFNQYMDDSVLRKASYAKLVASFNEKKYKLQELTDDFSKEDASMFVAVVNTCEDKPTYESTLLTAKLIYTHHLRRDNLKLFCRVNDLVDKLPDTIDAAIDEVLSNKERVNEYAIKLLSYTWEALYEHSFVADHYDKLLKKKRLERLYILVEYLKKRALLHYSELKKSLFETKQEEYGIQMTKDFLPALYPKIEDKSVDRNPVGISEMATNGITAENAPNTKSSDNIKPKRTTKGKNGTKIVPPPLDVAKMAQLEMARNLKKMGVDIGIIRKAAPLLTIDEIENI